MRDRLRDALLVTTYWDTCPESRTQFEGNLPARAWLFRHYLEDVAAHGFTARNRNFPFASMKRILADSMLVHDRGLVNLRGILRGEGSPDSAEGRKRAWAERRRGEMVGEGTFCMADEELRHLEALLDTFQGRGLRVTIVSFPLLPELVTDELREGTLRKYTEHLKGLAERRKVHIIDHVAGAPLQWDDFEIDCDHLTVPAREKYIDWALTNGLGEVAL